MAFTESILDSDGTNGLPYVPYDDFIVDDKYGLCGPELTSNEVISTF